MHMRLPCSSSNRLPASPSQATVIGQRSCPAQAKPVANKRALPRHAWSVLLSAAGGCVIGQGSLQFLGLLDCTFIFISMHACNVQHGVPGVHDVQLVQHCCLSNICPTSSCGTLYGSWYRHAALLIRQRVSVCWGESYI
jgi:hypothetical protein